MPHCPASFVWGANTTYQYQNIREVNFRNFTYTWKEDSGWPSKLKWHDPAAGKQVTLTDGRWRSADEDGGGDPSIPFAGLVFEDVGYGRLTGEGSEQAIVVLRWNSGGTQYSHYVFFYTLRNGQPISIAAFHSGDRSFFGLAQISAEKGTLIIDLFDPQKRTGDCCSEGVVRQKYRWESGRFQKLGSHTFLKAPAPSRIPVSIFGTHE